MSDVRAHVRPQPRHSIPATHACVCRASRTVSDTRDRRRLDRPPAGRGRAGGALPVAGPGHAVAHPALVDDRGRAVGLVGELVAQPLDVGAHDLGSGGGAPGPDPAQQATGPPSPEINR